MKKNIFILSLSMSFILVSCIPKNYEVLTEQHNKVLSFEDFVDFEIIAANTFGDSIICDKNTGILYVLYSNGCHEGLSPIYNADGTLKNIKDYAKIEE